jgi:hypothetical protein
MSTEWRLRELLDDINTSRRARGLREVTHRDLADAVGLHVDSISRMTRNIRIGQAWLDIVDRLSTALSEFAGRRVEPAELIARRSEPTGDAPKGTTQTAEARASGAAEDANESAPHGPGKGSGSRRNPE